jgi:hypothetical protein
MTDLEALVVAGYVFADEYSVPARPGRPAKVSDAELVALAVCQAAIGISSDRQFLGLVGRVLPGWFPHLPDQSQYNRRLRGLAELISRVQEQLVRWLDGGGVRLADGTQLALASYPGCQQRSHFAGFARYGYSKWGFIGWVKMIRRKPHRLLLTRLGLRQPHSWRKWDHSAILGGQPDTHKRCACPQGGRSDRRRGWCSERVVLSLVRCDRRRGR